MKKISILEPAAPAFKPRKHVAAYARVSMETERLKHSISAQISHYSALIQKNPEWIYAGVYADDAVSGTGIDGRGGAYPPDCRLQRRARRHYSRKINQPFCP